MDITDAIIRYRRFLKRRNFSPNTVKNYLNGLKLFVIWLDVPIEETTYRKIIAYMDYLLGKRLRPKTVNCYLNSVCQFYHYLSEEEEVPIVNPVKKPNIMKLPRGLPKHLSDEHIEILFKNLKGPRDRAMFMIMLRCGLRVEEVSHLSLGNIDLKRRILFIQDGKGAKDRIVYYANKKKVNLLSSSSPYDGHTDVECRHRSLYNPGSPGAQLHQNHTTLLPDIYPESTKGLLQSHGGHHATNGWQHKESLTSCGL